VLWILVLFAVAIVIAAILAPPPSTTAGRSQGDDASGQEFDGTPVDPETLGRLGTPETVAELVAQGRADELRGLGYRGDLPPEA